MSKVMVVCTCVEERERERELLLCSQRAMKEEKLNNTKPKLNARSSAPRSTRNYENCAITHNICIHIYIYIQPHNKF